MRKDFLGARKDFPAMRKDFLRARKDFLGPGKDFLAAGKDFPAMRKDFLRVRKDFLGPGKGFLATRKALLGARKDFLAAGKDFLGIRRALPVTSYEIIRSAMALTSTIYNFDVELADSDRGVYETLAVRAALHPSETEESLVARVLAYALEFTEGIAFSSGLADPDAPAIAVRDLTGAIRLWVDIGTPDAARLHKASKAAPRVVVYVHKDPRQFLSGLANERIHRADAIE
ncbi:MAG: YaeQ family protein, partial [Thermoanaerobaculia bacterium]